MVEYLRHKMSVSVLLYPETGKRMQDVESLKKIWDNVISLFILLNLKLSDYPKLNILYIIKYKRYMRLCNSNEPATDMDRIEQAELWFSTGKEYFVQLFVSSR